MHRRMAHFQTYRGNLLVVSCVEKRTQTQEPLAESTKNNPLLGECVRRTKSALNRGKKMSRGGVRNSPQFRAHLGAQSPKCS